MSSSSGKAYEEARALSELRNRFLFDSMKTMKRQASGAPVAARAARTAVEERRVREEVRSLASEALSADLRPRAVGREGVQVSWRVAIPVALAVALAVGFGLQDFGVIDVSGSGLERWSRDDLAAVSAYLIDGKRDRDGVGTAFVGTIDERWLALPPAERQAAAEELVSGLGERGVAQVMIYDAERTLRIQRLGARMINL
jgi:hypothetical protein